VRVRVCVCMCACVRVYAYVCMCVCVYVCVCVCTTVLVICFTYACVCTYAICAYVKVPLRQGGYLSICVRQIYWHLWGRVTKLIKRRRPSHPVDLAAGQQARRMSFVTLNCNLHGIKGSDKDTAISNRKVRN
jgi:hypothetical protein